MNPESIKNNNELVSKKDYMFSFVKDMVDIEQKEFELRMLAEKLDREAKWIEANSEKSLNDNLKSVEYNHSSIKEKIQENENYESRKRTLPQIPCDFSLTHDQICSINPRNVSKPDSSDYPLKGGRTCILGFLVWAAILQVLACVNYFCAFIGKYEDVAYGAMYIIGVVSFFTILVIVKIRLSQKDKKLHNQYKTD